MAELDDLKTAVANLAVQAKTISDALAALEGTTPAPGVLEGLANQINTIATGLGASAATAEPPIPPAS